VIFNSFIYLLFLPFVAVVYYLFPGKYRWIWLLVASIAYYLSFIPVFFGLVALMIAGNYLGGRWLKSMTEKGNGKMALTALVVLNLLVLAFFKYFRFLFPGLEIDLWFVDWFYRVDPITRMILPLGLSYLVFTVISYLIEIKRKTIDPEMHPGYFSLYLLFFPRIAQGPIDRPKVLLPQLREIHAFDNNLVTSGLKLMLWGYFKKLVVADRLAIYVNAVYGNSEHHNGTTLMVATVFFAFQIYADFSGYTDIALGSAQIFGIRLTGNFRQPYLATSVKDFWNRWHITFSTWLRDYLFLPLAFFFSKRMKKDRYLFLKTENWIYFFAIMITFAICGIWHGEGWHFLAWGVLFGLLLTLSNWLHPFGRHFRKILKVKKNSTLAQTFSIAITFLIICFTFIFFRADSLSTAGKIIKTICSSSGIPFYGSPAHVVYMLVGILLLVIADLGTEFFRTRTKLMFHPYPAVRLGSVVFLAMIILLVGVFDGGQFIYFQF